MCKQLVLMDFQHKSIKIIIYVMHQFLKKLVFWIEQNIINVDLKLFFKFDAVRMITVQYCLQCNTAKSLSWHLYWTKTVTQGNQFPHNSPTKPVTSNSNIQAT